MKKELIICRSCGKNFTGEDINWLTIRNDNTGEVLDEIPYCKPCLKKEIVALWEEAAQLPAPPGK